MKAQDHQPDPAPMTGTQVKSAGTGEPAARSDVAPETDESMARAGEQPESNGSTPTKSARVGLLQSIKRGLVGFAAGFRGTTWEHEADKAIKDDLKAFDEMRLLSDGDKQRLEQRIEPLLETQRDFLRSEAAVEAIANRVTRVLGICAVAVPAVVVGLVTPRGWGAVWDYFGQLSVVVVVATGPARAIEMLTGRTRARVIWMALVLWAYIALTVWWVAGHGSSEPDGAILVAVVCAATALAVLLVARVYILAWNKTAQIHAWAERRLEAAVVWILLGVVRVLVEEPGDGTPTPRVVRVLVEKPGVVHVFVEEPGDGTPEPPRRSGGDGTPTPLQRSGTARALLAQAAGAVNNYLPRLIDGRRAYSADAQKIASEAAAFLWDLRSAVNLPGGSMCQEDLGQLTATIEAWSIGSLAGLPRSLTADSRESSSRRPGLLQVVRKVLLGTLPLILLIAVTLLPLKMSAAVTQALAPFAVTWVLLSVASIFAPADVKMDTKTLFNR